MESTRCLIWNLLLPCFILVARPHSHYLLSKRQGESKLLQAGRVLFRVDEIERIVFFTYDQAKEAGADRDLLTQISSACMVVIVSFSLKVINKGSEDI